MKKVFLALAIVSVLAITSCKRTNEEMSKIDAPVDSTTVKIDSVSVDSTTVDTTQAGC